MNPQSHVSIRDEYDEVDARFKEALFAIHQSQRSPEERQRLLKALMDGHGNAPTAQKQLEAIRAVMKELRGN